MKKEDPRTRKLSEIKETEGIVPFLLSIFRGEANINEKVGSKLLAEKYFDDVYRAGDPTAPLLLQRQQRFRCLVVLGASTRSIVRKYYQDMIASIRKRLDTLTMALECPELFEGRTVLLKGLLQRLKALAEIIDGSGLLGDDPEEGDTLDKFKPARPPVSRAELDRTIYLADRWSFLLDILLWSPSTSAGLQAKPVRLGLLRELRQHLAETTSALRVGDSAILKKDFIKCPYCGRETPAYVRFLSDSLKWIPWWQRPKVTTVSKSAIREWASPQYSLMCSTTLELNPIYFPVEGFTCPQCSAESEAGQVSLSVRIQREKKQLSVSCGPLFLDELLILGKEIIVKKEELSFPFTESIVFNFSNGHVFFQIIDVNDTLAAIYDISDFNHEWAGSALHKVLTSTIGRKKLFRAFRKNYGPDFPFSEERYTFNRLIALTRFQHYPECFYDTIPTYSCEYIPTSVLDDGSHTITFGVSDHDGNAANAVSSSFTVDTVPPTLNVEAPVDGYITNNPKLTVSGTSNDTVSNPVSVTVNGKAVTVASNGSFSTIVQLEEGENTITVIATDAAGKSTTVTRKVTLDTTAPVIQSVTLTPNPVDAGATYIITVAVSE